MKDIRSLPQSQLDALCEVANIGAGHAATALSQMIGSTVMITVPRISVVRLKDMPALVDEPEEPVVGVLMHMHGDLTGRTLLVFPQQAAMRLAELLLRREPGSATELGELEQSAINEVGNILSSAYMNALSVFMGMILLPTPPRLAVDSSSSVLVTANLNLGADTDHVMRVESEFLMQGIDGRLRGFFLLFPDPASLTAILRAVRVA